MNEEVKQALEVIKQVCATFNGNLEQHQSIQNSVGVIQKALTVTGPGLVTKDEKAKK